MTQGPILLGDADPPTLQTDGQTTCNDCNLNTALCTKVRRAVKTSCIFVPVTHLKWLWNSFLSRYGASVAIRLCLYMIDVQLYRDDAGELSSVSRPVIHRRCRLLKKWLMRHRDTPYPTGLDKRLLAQRCHMTVTQVQPLYVLLCSGSSQDLPGGADHGGSLGAMRRWHLQCFRLWG